MIGIYTVLVVFLLVVLLLGAVKFGMWLQRERDKRDLIWAPVPARGPTYGDVVAGQFPAKPRIAPRVEGGANSHLHPSLFNDKAEQSYYERHGPGY